MGRCTQGTGVFQHCTLGYGVDAYLAKTSKFKSLRVDLFAEIPLDRNTATRFALLPMVLRRGTARFPTMRALSLKLDGLFGAEIGAGVFKMGERQFASWSLQCASPGLLPEDSRGAIREALGILVEMVSGPLTENGRSFSERYVRQEKDNLRKMIRAIRDDKMTYPIIRLFEEMCRGEPFAVHEYGFAEDLDGIDSKGLYDFYRKVTAACPVRIFAVGDVDPDWLASALAEAFEREEWLGRKAHSAVADGEQVSDAVALGGRRGDVKPGSGRGNIRRGPGDGGEPEPVIERQDVGQAKLAFGLRTPVTRADPQYPALLLCDAILGGSPQSKLFLNVREKSSLAYFAFSRVEATKGVMVILSGIDPDKFGVARKIILEQVEAVANGAITEEEMDHARKAVINRVRSRADSPGQMIVAALEGLINDAYEPDEEIVRKLEGVGKDEVVEIGAGLTLETVFFLTPGSGQ